MLAIWSFVVAVSFVLGGNFFRHYWLTWCPVLAVAAGVSLSRLLTRRVAMFAALTLLAPGLLAAAAILQLDRTHSGATASDDTRVEVDEPVAAWFHAVRRPGDRIYAMCASPGLYADAGIDPPTPFLWREHRPHVPRRDRADHGDAQQRPTAAVHRALPDADGLRRRWWARPGRAPLLRPAGRGSPGSTCSNADLAEHDGHASRRSR